MTSYNLKNLFFTCAEASKRRKRLSLPKDYVFFKETIINTIPSINVSANDCFFKEKYKIYLQIYLVCKPIPSSLKFDPNSVNLNYYISRGWSEEEGNHFLKQRQSTTSLSAFLKKYGDVQGLINYNNYISSHKKTFYDNYSKGNHKKYLRLCNIDYWINKGYSPDLAKEKMSSYYSDLGKKQYEKRRLNGEIFLTVRQLQYWINKGLSGEDAHKELSLRYGTRSLDYCIEKYGIIDGHFKFKERNDKWQATLNSKTDEEKCEILRKKTIRLTRYSKKSIHLFEAALKYVNDNHNIVFKKLYMKDKEFYIYDQNKKIIKFYDLMIKDINFIVEYNGIMFHPNKEILSTSEWNSWINIYSRISANEQFEIDEYKRNLALSKKYEYLVIWENENFEESKQKIINKILELYEHRND